MKRFLLAMLLLALAMPVLAADSTYAPGTCYFVQGNTGIVCGSGASITMDSGSTLTMNGTEVGGSYTLVNAAGGSANPWDYTGTLGIMNGSDTFQVFDVNITNADHTGGTNVVEVLNVGNITGDAQATETALNIGTGWDYALYASSLIEGILGLNITGAAVNLNASSNYAVNVATGTSTGDVTIGSTTPFSTQAITIRSGTGDVTVTSTDDMSLTATDDLTINGGSAGSIISIGTNTQGNVIHIGDNDTTADTITIGSAKDTVNVAVPAVIQSAGGTAGTGVAVVETFPAVRTATLTFTLSGANIINVADGGKTTGVKVFDFPQGHIVILGAVINASVTATGTFNASAADIYYVSVGTVDGTQAADADLTSTEQNIIAKTTLDTASGVTLTHAVQAAMGTLAFADNVFDGHTTATALYFNVAVPDANATTATTHAVTGTLKVTYANLGDY